MFCPKCKYEYKEGISKCPDCDETLVVNLPSEVEDEFESDDHKKYDDWVQIARINSQFYAQMIVEALRAKDIPAVIQSGTGHFGITGQMGISFRAVGGGFSLAVPREFIEDADEEASIILGEEWEKSKLPYNE